MPQRVSRCCRESPFTAPLQLTERFSDKIEFSPEKIIVIYYSIIVCVVNCCIFIGVNYILVGKLSSLCLSCERIICKSLLYSPDKRSALT